MKIHVLSDLHIEFLDDADEFFIEPSCADVLVLSGDIGIGDKGVRWACVQSEHLGIPVIYVPGNHEFYCHEMLSTLEDMRHVAAGHNVHVLNNDSLVIGDVRFLGSTLWTDYCASGDRDSAMDAAEECMNDHRLIRYQDHVFSPEDAEKLHFESVAWLAEQLSHSFKGKTVVVTHHGPTPAAQSALYPIDDITAAFWTNLDYLVAKSDLWIYGHTHSCLDELVRGTRVVSNQTGYRNSIDDPAEDPRFDPRFVVEV